MKNKKKAISRIIDHIASTTFSTDGSTGDLLSRFADALEDGTIVIGIYTLPEATATTLGGVIIGDGVDVDESGTISVEGYELPVASASTLGGVKVGTGLKIEDGVLSVDSSEA